MIRLEMTEITKREELQETSVVYHNERRTLLLQEWHDGSAPDEIALIAHINSLVFPVCQCGHRKTSHTESWHNGRCAVAGCDCRKFQDPVVVARERAAERERVLEKRLATLQAMEVVQAKQLITANKRASDHNLEARRARESLVRAQAKLRALRGSAPKKGRRG